MSANREQIAHSRIEFVVQPTAQPKGMVTAAIKSCCGCGVIINGMGGGATYICKPCLVILTSGVLTKAFNEAAQESK